VPQVALLGVHPALGVLAQVVGEELVERRRVARGEVALDALAGHPRV
jgi:hypothetical protein